MNKPCVSVIITTKNSAETLLLCLRSIRKQTYQDLEIIVVDNNSTDSTQHIARKCTNKVYTYGPERSAQRNCGASHAKGTFLLFLDSDMELSKNVIQECVTTSVLKKADALYIPEIIAGNSVWSRVRTFERSFYNGTVIDAVRFISMELFKRLNGYDESLTGPEDWDLDKRVRQVGTTAVINPPITHHEESVSIIRYIQKKLYYSHDFSKYIQKWGTHDVDIQKQFGLYYRYIGVFYENSKWKKILSYPQLTIPLLFLRTLLGLSYLVSKMYNKK